MLIKIKAFWPYSFLTSLYKIAAKVLPDRRGKVIVPSLHQVAFVKGKQNYYKARLPFLFLFIRIL